jgi:malonyl CoA-acyl carrier protein transacylase
MATAASQFEEFQDSIEIKAPRIPVMSNVTADIHQPGSIKANMARQMTHPVRWVDTVLRMKREPSPSFLELGPGTVLTGLNRRIEMETAHATGH